MSQGPAGKPRTPEHVAVLGPRIRNVRGGASTVLAKVVWLSVCEAPRNTNMLEVTEVVRHVTVLTLAVSDRQFINQLVVYNAHGSHSAGVF